MRLTRWDSELSTDQSNVFLQHLSEWHLSQIRRDTLVRDQLRELLRRARVTGSYLDVCQYELCYSDVTSAADLYHVRQVLAFFQKRKDLNLGIDRRAVAYEKFVDAESLCKETNDIFRQVARGSFSLLRGAEPLLFKAQRKIATILGDVPSLSELRLRFGPGATTQVKKKDASARRKLSQTFACSGEAVALVTELLSEMPTWSDLTVDGPESVSQTVAIHGGTLSFVPKSALTDRSIVVEPMLNSMVQLGIGDYMAHRLRRFGVDIRDQRRNQNLAWIGSVSGALATLDLRSASDTVSSGLVESLLPVDWWNLLRTFRTGSISLKGADAPMRLEKFSSMGNGFTFPLETLIFYALACACVEDKDVSDVSVYGDDIVIPTYAYDRLVWLLRICGFLPNLAKSFSSGHFRESCGKDYYLGIDVRPCYIKATLSGSSLFILHNFYVRRGLTGPLSYILALIDRSMAIYGPDGYGDGHLLGDYTPKPTGRSKGWAGFTFETYTYKSRSGLYRLGADYVYPSYSIYMKEETSHDVPFRYIDGHSHASALRDFALSFREGRSDSELARDERGRSFLKDTLPGVSGYKRIKIYKLTP